MTGSPRCVDLLDEHRRFEVVLRRLWGDVLQRRADPAPMRWLDRSLRAHAAFEEERLFPVFEELDHPVANGSPEVMRRDHRLIVGHLDALASGWEGDPVGRAQHLARLAGVLDHHDRREARYLLPRLDEVLAPEAIASIWADHPALDEPPVAGDLRESPGEPPVGAPSLERVRWWVATGQTQQALDELPALSAGPEGKGPRLVARTQAALVAGDLVAAWDALALVTAILR